MVLSENLKGECYEKENFGNMPISVSFGNVAGSIGAKTA